ncbi:hypothetical protein LJB91_03555 [Bacteroidales bacterium OttesenSCG-928-L03]|nr:hypothetical protein [Bacteroidales bacterium OttesenSCG-928-L03]
MRNKIEFAVDKKKIAKNTLTLYFRMAFTMLVGFFVTRVSLEVLGSQDFGLNNLVGGVVAMFSFINGSMGTAVQRFYSVSIGKGDTEKIKKIFGCGLYLHIIVAIITLIIAEIFAFFFLYKLNIPIERQNAAQIVFQLAIISMVIHIVNVPYTAMLRAREDFTTIAFADIITALLRLGILYLLYIIDYDKLILFSILNFMISLWSVGFLTIKARKYKETHTFICRDKGLIKEMLAFVSLLLFTVLAQVVRDNGLTLLVNLFFGLVLNAAFAIASQVSHLVTGFVMNFKQSIVPQLMAAWGAGDKNAVYGLINLGTKITFLLMLVISLPIITESEFLLRIWLKAPPLYSSNLVSLAIISVNISSFTYFLYQAVHATGKIKSQQIAISVLYFLNILFIYLAYKLGGNFYMAYYITILASVGQCVINIYFANKYLGFSAFSFCKNIVSRCIITAILTIIPCILVINFIEMGWMRLIINSILILSTCCIIGFFLLMNKGEKDKVIILIRGILNRKVR